MVIVQDGFPIVNIINPIVNYQIKYHQILPLNQIKWRFMVLIWGFDLMISILKNYHQIKSPADESLHLPELAAAHGRDGGLGPHGAGPHTVVGALHGISGETHGEDMVNVW